MNTLEKKLITLDTGVQYYAFINENGGCEKIKLVTNVPRRFYYSYLNEIGLDAERRFRIAS